MPNELSTIAHDINAYHDMAVKSAIKAVEHAKSAGDLLLQAKAAVPHGQWLEWLAANFNGSERTARAYVSVSRNWEAIDAKRQSSADLSIDGALKLIQTKSLQDVEGWDDLAAPVKKALETKTVKAKPKEVQALAEFDKQSQKSILESVAKGEVESITEAITIADPPTETEAADPVELALALAPEFEEQRRKLQQVKKWMLEMVKTAAGGGLKEEGRKIERYLEDARHGLLFTKPFAACSYCGGVVDESITRCEACKGRGWLNKQEAEAAPK